MDALETQVAQPSASGAGRSGTAATAPVRPAAGGSDPRVLTSRTYEILRERIIRGHYEQGSRLSEARIADELGVSRVPVRDAIPRLRSAGFVTSRPRGGTFVWTWTRHSADEVFELRGSLESLAARLAARAVKEGASPAAIQASLDRTDGALESGDRLIIAEAIHDFHLKIVELSGNHLLRDLMGSITQRMVWLMFLTWQGAVGTVTEEHADILEAISKGNEALAAAIAFTHVERARPKSLQLFSDRTR